MPQFIDTAKITVRSGNKESSAVAFHRERNLWRPGGPTAATAGGGNIILRVDGHMSTPDGLPLQEKLQRRKRHGRLRQALHRSRTARTSSSGPPGWHRGPGR